MPEKTIQHGAVDERAATEAVGPILPPLPEARLGLLFAGLLFFADVTGTVVSSFDLFMFRFLVLLAGVAYWFYCVDRLHRIVNELEPDYPISPEAAVGLHFLPFFSLFWIFKWPMEMSRFIKRRGLTEVAAGGWLGLGIFASISVGQVYWGAGLAAVFLFTWYLADKLSHEVQYNQVALPPLEEARAAWAAFGVLAANAVNYLIANTGFVLLLLVLSGGAPGAAFVGAYAFIFGVSGFAAGVTGGHIARRSGPAVGVPANLAVLGSVAIGVNIFRQYDVSSPIPGPLVFLAMAAASFVLSVLGTSVGERWYRERRYPYLWLIEEKEALEDPFSIAEEPESPMALEARAADNPVPSALRLPGGLVLGNLIGIQILLFYRYPAALIELVWDDQIYFIARMSDSLVIVTGAFVAAYVAMLIAKEEPWAVGVGANFIMYLTMAELILDSLMGGEFWTGLGGVLPFLPVVVVAGILGAREAETNLSGSTT